MPTDTFDEYSDATTAVAAAKKNPKQPPTDIVALNLPRVAGLRRIHHLFTKGGSEFFRANFHEDGKITSFWVEVVGGEAIVTPEANHPFVPVIK